MNKCVNRKKIKRYIFAKNLFLKKKNIIFFRAIFFSMAPKNKSGSDRKLSSIQWNSYQIYDKIENLCLTTVV